MIGRGRSDWFPTLSSNQDLTVLNLCRRKISSSSTNLFSSSTNYYQFIFSSMEVIITIMWILAIGVWVYFLATVLKDKSDEQRNRRIADQWTREYLEKQVK